MNFLGLPTLRLARAQMFAFGRIGGVGNLG